MAFALALFCRVQQTEDLDKTINPNGGMDTTVRPQTWIYNGITGVDTSAAIVAANFFNGAHGYLSVGDMVIFNSTTGAGMCSVATNDGTNVTTVLRTV